MTCIFSFFYSLYSANLVAFVLYREGVRSDHPGARGKQNAAAKYYNTKNSVPGTCRARNTKYLQYY